MKNNIKINKKETKEVLASKKEQKKVNDKDVKEKKVKTAIEKHDWYKTYYYKPFMNIFGGEKDMSRDEFERVQKEKAKVTEDSEKESKTE